MADSILGGMLGEFLGSTVEHGTLEVPRQLNNPQKVLLTATAVVGYVVARVTLATLGLPEIPHVSAMLLQDEPLLAVVAFAVLMIILTVAARPLVGNIRYEAPLFCSALAMLALPCAGGDSRNALLDAGSGGVYVKMIIEQAILAGILVAAYLALLRKTPPLNVGEVDASPMHEQPIDDANDRATTVAIQAVVTLGLLTILGQSPMKGQAMLGVALAAGLGSWVTYKSRSVRGSVWYVAGTMLAGLVAYVWTAMHPDGIALGDVRGFLAGPARSLPLHYATAGVGGAIYGYWIGRSAEAEAAE